MRELGIADLTLVGFLLAVNPRVNRQAGSPCKASAADFTLVWFFVGVSYQVLCQRGFE
jgi:hypothetical protein